MSACSRCNSRWPNSSCFVCAEPDKYPDDDDQEHDDYADDQGHDDYVERLLDRADHLRTERKDSEWEDGLPPHLTTSA